MRALLCSALFVAGAGVTRAADGDEILIEAGAGQPKVTSSGGLINTKYHVSASGTYRVPDPLIERHAPTGFVTRTVTYFVEKVEVVPIFAAPGQPLAVIPGSAATVRQQPPALPLYGSRSLPAKDVTAYVSGTRVGARVTVTTTKQEMINHPPPLVGPPSPPSVTYTTVTKSRDFETVR